MSTLYRYKAIDQFGHIRKGICNALNELDLSKTLEGAGLTLLTAAQVKPSHQLKFSRKLSIREQIDFFYYLEMLLKAGLPIIDILHDMSESSRHTTLKELAVMIADEINNGSSLSQAINSTQQFNRELVKLIDTGERSGSLVEILHDIVTSLKWRDDLARRAKKALIYPAFALVTILGTATFLLSYIVPQIVEFIKSTGTSLPLQTRLLIMTSDFVKNWWWTATLFIFVTLTATSLLTKLSTSVKYNIDKLILNAPIIGGILKKLYIARIVDTLALMYRSGIPIFEALAQSTQLVSNSALSRALENTHARLASGLTISQAFSYEDIFPPIVVRMIRIGEESGNLDESFKNISYFYLRDIDDSIDRIHSTIEPMMTLFLGLLLGWIALSVIGPVYDVLSMMKM